MPRQSECTTLVLDHEKIRVWMHAALIEAGLGISQQTTPVLSYSSLIRTWVN